MHLKKPETSTNVEDESRAERRVKKDKRMDRPPGGFVDVCKFTLLSTCVSSNDVGLQEFLHLLRAMRLLMLSMPQ